MFIILLTYLKPLDEVARFVDSHRAWLQQGFDEGSFILAGGQRPLTGSVLIALGPNRSTMESRITQDPFILNGIASAQIIEFTASRLDSRLAFLSLPRYEGRQGASG